MNINKKNHSQHTKVSELLKELYENPQFNENLTLGKLTDLLAHHSYGIGILIFALPSILPCSAIPGVSFLFGLPIFLLGAQLIFAKKTPWLPKWLRAKTLSTKTITQYIKQAIPYIQRFEKFIQPRYLIVSSHIAKSFIGIILVLLSILLMLPIPFSNVLFGSLIAFIALGLIESDGLILSTCSIASVITISFFIEAIRWLVLWLF